MPSFVLNLIKKYSMMVLAFTLARIFFYIFNKSQLVSATLIDFILGIWFDCITTAILFLPLMLMEIVPQKCRLKSWHQTASKLLYFIILTPSLLINIADIEYFKYTSTRSTFSTFKMLSYGSDFTNQLPSFLKDYWFLLCLLILILFAVNWLYNKWIKPPASTLKLSTQLVSVAILMICLLSVGRGWGLRPISPLHASQYTEDQNAPLVLNSAFTILKSAGKQVIDEKTFFDEKAIKSYFNPVKHYHSGAELNQPNVVILMLESFSVEYISGINGDSVSYTPFLDSLIGEGLVFINAFANGKKSIDAVPSVISSIPKLMPEEFITSSYATNQIESIPQTLKSLGYTSSFYHAASNGSMNFDGFASKVNFDHYNGRNEYNNDDDYDGTWGIYDHLFLPWAAKNFSTLESPFFATIFTISSHPPYRIPDHLQNQFSGGPTDMHNAVRYADYALKLFFEQAKKEAWYENTLFIITADHTPASAKQMYFNDRGIMSIPLVFYHPISDKFKGQSEKIVGQIDIMPSILDLVGYDKPFYSFGESVFAQKEGFTTTLLGDKYLVYGYGYFMVFQQGKVIRLYSINDKTLKHTLLADKQEIVKFLKNKLLAYIQTYHNDMINNNLMSK